MKHYIELTLIANTDINAFSLWSKLYQQLHLALVEMQDQHQRVPIGLSFPEYRMNEKYGVLGCKCRLFAAEPTNLERLNLAHWLERLSDYVHCTSIRPVPEKLSGYAIYQREQPKATKERLARRYARYHKVDYETALHRYSDRSFERVGRPFIRLKSLSSEHTFCLWIKKTLVTEPLGDSYSSYGLSAVSSVPEF